MLFVCMCATVDVHRGQEKPAEMGSVLPQWGPRMELSRGGTVPLPTEPSHWPSVLLSVL